MIGAILNAAGIIAGGIAGLARKTPLPATTQYFFKSGLGAFTAFCGLRLVWLSVNGSFPLILKQFAIVALSFLLGKWTGHLLHLQKISNRLGQRARERIGKVSVPAIVENNYPFKRLATVCRHPICKRRAIQSKVVRPI